MFLSFRWRGWIEKRTQSDSSRVKGSISKACTDDDLAPVSILALMRLTLSSGSDSHSLQPIVGGDSAAAREGSTDADFQSREEFGDNPAFDIGQTEVASRVFVGQTLMVESQ